MTVNEGMGKIIADKMSWFHCHMHNVINLTVNSYPDKEVLEQIIKMIEVLRELQPLRLQLDERYPEYKKLFQCLGLINTSLDMVSKIMDNINKDGKLLAKHMKELKQLKEQEND